MDARTIPSERQPIDFVWFDAGGYEEYQRFIYDVLPLINPAGGVAALHFTLNNPYLMHVVKDLQLRRPDIEILSLFEPHKCHQNSLTLLRHTSGWRDEFYASEKAMRWLNADLDSVSTKFSNPEPGS